MLDSQACQVCIHNDIASRTKRLDEAAQDRWMTLRWVQENRAGLGEPAIHDIKSPFRGQRIRKELRPGRYS